MAERRLSPRRLALGAVLAAAVAWLAGPGLLRRVDFFRVRRVELVGVRYLPTRDVLGRLGIPASASLFDDTDPIAARAVTMIGIEHAEVSRRWPGTLRVRIRERPPVALVPSGGRLVPVDARGRRLPYDPVLGAPDVPVAAAADPVLARFLGRMQQLDLGFFSGISAAWRVRDHIVLQVGGRRVLLRPDATAEVIRAVMAVTDDLARKGRDYAELDGRFAGQVVVRPRGPGGSARSGA